MKDDIYKNPETFGRLQMQLAKKKVSRENSKTITESATTAQNYTSNTGLSADVLAIQAESDGRKHIGAFVYTKNRADAFAVRETVDEIKNKLRETGIIVGKK